MGILENFWQRWKPFCWAASKLITYHFEDTPREAVKGQNLAGFFLLGPNFCEAP